MTLENRPIIINIERPETRPPAEEMADRPSLRELAQEYVRDKKFEAARNIAEQNGNTEYVEANNTDAPRKQKLCDRAENLCLGTADRWLNQLNPNRVS